MRSEGAIRLTALLLCLCLSAAWAADTGEMKMHRQQAGAPDPSDKSGWMLAASTQGRFSVRLPLKFNDFTVTEVPEAPALRTHTVGTRSSEKISFVATRIVYRKGAAAAKAYFARFEKGQGQTAKPVSVAPRQVGALRAVDLVFKGPGAVSYQRVVLLDTDLLMLSVESPSEHDEAAWKLAGTFFDSLQVDAK
jgi:hypothetical protein